MAAPLGNHGEGASGSDPAPDVARQIRSAELESAVEVLRARVLELGASEAIPEKAATDVAGALPGMLEDGTVLNFSVNTVSLLAAAFLGDDAEGLQQVFLLSHAGGDAATRKKKLLAVMKEALAPLLAQSLRLAEVDGSDGFVEAADGSFVAESVATARVSLGLDLSPSPSRANNPFKTPMGTGRTPAPGSAAAPAVDPPLLEVESAADPSSAQDQRFLALEGAVSRLARMFEDKGRSEASASQTGQQPARQVEPAAVSADVAFAAAVRHLPEAVRAEALAALVSASAADSDSPADPSTADEGGAPAAAGANAQHAIDVDASASAPPPAPAPASAAPISSVSPDVAAMLKHSQDMMEKVLSSQKEMFAPVGRSLAALEERLDKIERGEKDAEEPSPEDRAYVPHYDGETLSPVWKESKDESGSVIFSEDDATQTKVYTPFTLGRARGSEGGAGDMPRVLSPKGADTYDFLSNGESRKAGRYHEYTCLYSSLSFLWDLQQFTADMSARLLSDDVSQKEKAEILERQHNTLSGVYGLLNRRLNLLEILTRIDDPKTPKEQKELDQALVMTLEQKSKGASRHLGSESQIDSVLQKESESQESGFLAGFSRALTKQAASAAVLTARRHGDDSRSRRNAKGSRVTVTSPPGTAVSASAGGTAGSAGRK